MRAFTAIAGAFAMGAVAALGGAAQAAPVHVDFTGKVDVIFGPSVPINIAVGTAVTGSFTYTPSAAAAPTYSFTSCSSCGGAVTATFEFATNFAFNVEIAGHTWSTRVGQIFLDSAQLFGINSETVGIAADTDEGHVFTSFPVPGALALARQLMYVAFTDQQDPMGLLDNGDVNTIPEEPFDLSAATFRSGTISNTRFVDDEVQGYYVQFSIDPIAAAVPEPGSLALMLGGIALLCRLRRRAAGALA